MAQWHKLRSGQWVNLDHIADFGEYIITPKNQYEEEEKKVFLLKKAHPGKSGHPENIWVTKEDIEDIENILETMDDIIM